MDMATLVFNPHVLIARPLQQTLPDLNPTYMLRKTARQQSVHNIIDRDAVQSNKKPSHSLSNTRYDYTVSSSGILNISFCTMLQMTQESKRGDENGKRRVKLW